MLQIFSMKLKYVRRDWEREKAGFSAMNINLRWHRHGVAHWLDRPWKSWLTANQSRQPGAIHICTILSNNPWDLWNILTILIRGQNTKKWQAKNTFYTYINIVITITSVKTMPITSTMTISTKCLNDYQLCLDDYYLSFTSGMLHH